MEIKFEVADGSMIDSLLPLMRAYHECEDVRMSDAERTAALAPLLENDSPLGRVWLIWRSGRAVGYIVLCFGYSIEFKGRDAVIDEMFFVEVARNQGIGAATLHFVKREASLLGVVALHLEVDARNEGAIHLYRKSGFHARARFHLMSCELT
jgi:GNAT superfamily N-acetyltransferase